MFGCSPEVKLIDQLFKTEGGGGLPLFRKSMTFNVQMPARSFGWSCFPVYSAESRLVELMPKTAVVSSGMKRPVGFATPVIRRAAASSKVTPM